MTKYIVQDSNNSLKVTQSSIQVCTTCTPENTLPCLIDKFASLAVENNGVALLVTNAIAVSVVIYAVSKSVAVIITAWRSNE